MTDLHRAARHAREVLDYVDRFLTMNKVIREELVRDAIADLDKALAQPEQYHGFDRTASHMTGEYVDSAEQEPVAWVRDLTSPSTHCVTSLKYLSIADTDAGVKYIPVYTAPPSKPWVSLTQDGLLEIVNQCRWKRMSQIELARAIEAALKEKNT